MLSLIFDLDDTLYFQQEQFERAVNVSGLLTNENKIKELYESFRARSEVNYLLHEQGKISLEKNRLCRIQEAFALIGSSITNEQAHSWQECYEKEISKLQLNPLIKKMLTECQDRHIQLGIITNGPSEHQRNKIKALGLNRWFAANQIIVSDDLGISKPEPAIFQKMLDQLPKKTKSYYYIGDNYLNDISGATNFGWETIWLNPLQETQTPNLSSYEVSSHEELVTLVKMLIDKNWK